LVTVFCPLIRTGAGEFVVQTTGETRFVVDCKVNPVALAGHIKMKFVPERSAEVVGGGASTLAMAMYGENFPPDVMKSPAAYNVLPDVTTAFTALLNPGPSADQLLPSHAAMFVAPTLPAVMNTPPTYKVPPDAVSAVTLVSLNLPLLTPEPSGDQLVPSHCAM